MSTKSRIVSHRLQAGRQRTPEAANTDCTDAPAARAAGQAGEVAQVLQPYGVGIDTHCRFISVCVLKNVQGAVVRHEKEFTTDWPALVRAKGWVASLLEGVAPADITYCIESTGAYHLPVIRAFGGRPCVVNPLLAGPTRRKTDVLDARLLAHHSITGLWPNSFVPSEQGQQLRVLWAARNERVRAATRCANRLNNTILRFGHTLGSGMPLRSPAAVALMETMCTGQVPDVPTIAPTGLPAAVRPVVKRLLEDMQEALAEAKLACWVAVEFVRSHQWPTAAGEVGGGRLLECLKSVPGVGEATAMTWLSEVCDPGRFADGKQVAAYAGCDPSLKVSAGKVTSAVRRKGNLRIHVALLHAAGAVLMHRGEPLGDWARALAGKHRKGGYRKALGAVARRIARALWEVHMRAAPFSYEGYHLERALPVERVPIGQMGLPASDLRRLAPLKFSTEAAALAARSGGAAGGMKLPRSTTERIRAWADAHRMKPAVGPVWAVRQKAGQ